MTPSTTHLVILPSYNSGPRLLEVVQAVLAQWRPVMVVVDGSTDESEKPVLELARCEPALQVLRLPQNSGKGAAVLAGAAAARASGFTHALVMDSDGQHPEQCIADFMRISAADPAALVLGRPIFPANVPAARLHGRKLSIGLVAFEILGRGIGDPLFGFRVYPIGPLLAALSRRRTGRRYDFDTEAAVRLVWAGVPPINVAAPVRYFDRSAGGISHFHYGRDNAALVWMHTRLITELLVRRWPGVIAQCRRRRTRREDPAAALASDSRR
jgi:glycosyltransferase involved in cell wall biosynthesis